MATLPVEILDVIIQCLADDDDYIALRSVCLANHYVCQECRKRLFATVKLNEEFDVASYMNSGFTSPPHPFERFSQVLFINSTLSSNIRTLEIGVMLRFAYPSLDNAFKVLNQVEVFSFGFHHGLRGGDFRSPWDSILQPLRGDLEGFLVRNPIRKLSLFGICGFPSEIFSRMQYLRSIQLEQFRVAGFDDVDTKAAECVKVPLDSLHLLNGMDIFADGMTLLSGISKLLDLSRVRKLVIKIELQNEEILQQILPQIEALEVLNIEIDINRGTLRDKLFPYFSDGTFSSLRSLSLKMNTSAYMIFPPFLFFDLDLGNIIVSGSSHLGNLESLSLTLNSSHTSFISAIPNDWSTLNRAFSNLNSVLPNPDTRPNPLRNLRMLKVAIYFEFMAGLERAVPTFVDIVERLLQDSLLWAQNFPELVVMSKVEGTTSKM